MVMHFNYKFDEFIKFIDFMHYKGQGEGGKSLFSLYFLKYVVNGFSLRLILHMIFSLLPK